VNPPPPLGVYVHWPYCARICPYCDFNVYRVRREGEPAALARAIVADLEAQARLTGPRTLVSIFFGGGTPSLMDPAWAAEIIAAARRLWTPAADLEVSLEANPTDAEADRFAALAQALDDAALRFLGRNHDAATGLRAARAAADHFPRLSLDLIYARPGQTAKAWGEELRQAIALGAEHLSPYQLTVEHGTAFDRAVRRGRIVLADPDLGAELYETTQAVLEAAGFEAYEVSNHARGASARSRHNLVYWQGLDYVGAGPGAHGRLTLEGVRQATIAAARPADYIAAVAERGTGFAEVERLTPRQAAEERVLTGLRIGEGVARAELAPLMIPERRLNELVELGLLADDPDRVRATPAGRLVLDRLTAEIALGA
jgi:putative oxygen-independent coproporphyrinogen III oxidase